MYKTLNIEGELSLGIIAYIFKNHNYINSQFINRLNNAYLVNNIDKLIKLGFIKIKESNIVGRFKIPPKFYEPTNSLLSLNEIIITDKRLEKLIDSSLHLLNNWHFNHWNYNYSKIEFNVPESKMDFPDILKKRYETKENYLKQFNETIKPYWGAHKKDYYLNICSDDTFSGRHHNFFTYHKKELRRYLFEDPCEVDVAFCQPLLLADSLTKAFGSNDFSNVLMNDNYDIYTLIGKTREEGKKLFNNTIFDISYPNYFSQGFPEAFNYILKVKQGNTDEFKRFCKEKVYSTDNRLYLKKEDRNYNRAKSCGQLHYKVLSLILQLREVELMRKVWVELKKQKIIFVPIHDSVVIDRGNVDVTEKVFKQVWKQGLNPKLKIRISIK
jgi:hypothetical protein